MAYATVDEVESGFRDLTETEKPICTELLEESAIIIDSYNAAGNDAKQLVSCRMVRRAIGSGDDSQAFPIGASQGSVSAMGYSQSWQLGTGSTGELYLSKLEKKLLGVGNSIGSYSPTESLVES